MLNSRVVMPILKPHFILFFILSHLCFLGQNRETDSLLNIVKTGKTKEKIDALNELCITVLYNNTAQAKRYVLRAIEESGQSSYKTGEAKAFNRLGIVYDISGNYDSSIICYNKALEISLASKNPKGAGSAYNNLGLINGKRGRLNEALTFYFKALPYFEEVNSKEYLGNLHNNISLVYEKTRDHRMAISYALKALNYYKEIGDDENVGGTYTNLYVSYSSINVDSASYYIKQAIVYNTKTNNLYGLSTAYNDYGTFLSEQKQCKLSQEYYFKALDIKKQLNENEGIASIYTNLSDNYRQIGDKKNTLINLLKAYEVSKQNHLQNQLLIIYEGLSKYYSMVNKADSVYYFLSLYNTQKDSIYTKELKNSLAETQTKYETKEKELTIKSQQYQLSRKNYYIIGLISFMLFIVLIFYTFYTRFRFKQKNKLQQEIIHQQDITTKAVIRAEENERKRVASDLHDSVGQMLSAIKINLSAFKPNIRGNNTERFEKIMSMVDDSCKEVRAISHNMMPNSLLKNGLVLAIREFIGQLNQSSLIINIETSGLNDRLDDNVETVLYRVIQECVNNVVKHANATRLDLQLIKDSEGIAITIEDNGVGFDTSTIKDGIGLTNLSSRIAFLKGSVDISSSASMGTLIAIFIPKQK